MEGLVGDLPVHQAPKPLNRVRLWPAGQDEVRFDSPARLCQPPGYALRMMAPGVVWERHDHPKSVKWPVQQWRGS